MTRRNIEYFGWLTAALLMALAASWTDLGLQLDNSAYDWIFRHYRPADWEPQSAVLALDDESVKAYQGVRGLRDALVDSLELVAKAAPRAVAIDVMLAEPGAPETDARLEAALRRIPNVVLPCDLQADGKAWEDPIDRFRRLAAGLGHVHAEPDPVSREILLQKVAARDRRWALALEAYRAGRGASILETPNDLEVAGAAIPAALRKDRALRIRYRPPDRAIPRVGLQQLKADPARTAGFTGKTVFIGATGQIIARDRLQTPYTENHVPMAGVEIHASVFETIAQRLFLSDVPVSLTVLLCAVVVALAGVIFAFLPGWRAYAAAAALLVAAQSAPYLFFTHSLVLPFLSPTLAAWLGISTAATYQHFIVRRRMLKAEGDRHRYQQAMHFVTHEMRTPLTAIQGSSELIGRYNLNEDKRKQIAELIHSESKRLGKMIEIFLSVERLSAGQVELKKEPFDGLALMSACIGRVQPLAERKRISISLQPDFEAPLHGDRELMDYAFYNLLTNAVKYSPPGTAVSVFSRRDGPQLRIAVQDQGIGMDHKEVRQIFQKFYRTKKAEESGETGTGIGLSIVEQIVTQHGGSIEVASSPGQGSCFTLVLPAATVTAD
ncbi:MAG: CHASE2 domain-containing protein [Candidatus Solibacter usitatus]|nr:CHASE2 domain-containing protein [Candidatus Solibacter usitatus]